jgi:hypothetical protein
MLHKKADAMFFWLDGERLRDLQSFDVSDVQFVASGGTIVLSKLPSEDQ